MKRIQPGPGFTIFVIFFAIAFLDAIAEGNVWRIVFWILMGAFFLLLDIRRKKI